MWGRYEKKLDWLRGLLANTKEELRETVSLLYGLVASGLGLAEFEKAMRDLSRSWKVSLLISCTVPVPVPRYLPNLFLRYRSESA